MAIWQPSAGDSPRFGVSGGELWAKGQGSNVLQALPRPANRAAREAFQQWTNRAPWNVIWASLSPTVRAEWDAFAAATLWQGLTGRPDHPTGQRFFSGYCAQAVLFATSVPSSPFPVPDLPTWTGNHQPFEPFLDPADGMAIITKASNAADALYFFAAQPPMRTKQKLTRATCRPVGTFTLPAGAAGRAWTEPMDAVEAMFGPEAKEPGWQQWLLAWEVSGGWCQPVLDPCWSPPALPAGTLGVEIPTTPEFPAFGVYELEEIPLEFWRHVADGPIGECGTEWRADIGAYRTYGIKTVGSTTLAWSAFKAAAYGDVEGHYISSSVGHPDAFVGFV